MSAVRVLNLVADFSGALDAERRAGRTVGLVPTMGALHAGHGSLVERAAAECDVVAVTVFVNPLQFGAGEDLDAYPRTLDADVALAEAAGASIVLAPTVAEMYGEGTATTVSVASDMTAVLEGASRPGHFDGVATVVAKLFAMAGRCRAYFGEKDFQQLAIVRRMARDLSFPVEVVGCPTVRADDGLALSSRNAYLSPEERTTALALPRALATRSPERARALLDAQPGLDVDYVDLVQLDGRTVLAAAVRVGSTRLIDNVVLDQKTEEV